MHFLVKFYSRLLFLYGTTIYCLRKQVSANLRRQTPSAARIFPQKYTFSASNRYCFYFGCGCYSCLCPTEQVPVGDWSFNVSRFCRLSCGREDCNQKKLWARRVSWLRKNEGWWFQTPCILAICCSKLAETAVWRLLDWCWFVRWFWTRALQFVVDFYHWSSYRSAQ